MTRKRMTMMMKRKNTDRPLKNTPACRQAGICCVMRPPHWLVKMDCSGQSQPIANLE